jgi:enamine deaminase RidA (YjgF/YER057c/UK114 family)
MKCEASVLPERRMAELGIRLPEAQSPLAAHLPLVVANGLVFVSGHGPMNSAREPVCVGPIGSAHTVDEGAEAARLAAMSALASLRLAIGSLDYVRKVVKLNGYVLSAPGFDRQPWVIDGASSLLVDVFGPDRGPHARTSVGVAASALHLSVTVELIFAVDEAR